MSDNQLVVTDYVTGFTDITVAELRKLYKGGLFESLEADEWVGLDLEQVQALRKFLMTGYTVFSELRSSFDTTLWPLRRSGKYVEVEPCRKEGDYKNGTPGRKAKSLDAKLDDKIGG